MRRKHRHDDALRDDLYPLCMLCGEATDGEADEWIKHYANKHCMSPNPGPLRRLHSCWPREQLLVGCVRLHAAKRVVGRPLGVCRRFALSYVLQRLQQEGGAGDYGNNDLPGDCVHFLFSVDHMCNM